MEDRHLEYLKRRQANGDLDLSINEDVLPPFTKTVMVYFNNNFFGACPYYWMCYTALGKWTIRIKKYAGRTERHDSKAFLEWKASATS